MKLIIQIFIFILPAILSAKVNEEWIVQYGGSEGGYAYSMVLDEESNVYVTGKSGTTYGGDYLTIKYDKDGNELWAKRYNGPEGRDDHATSIAVDNKGNVYVTGRSQGPGLSYNYDYATIKYDKNGNELWVKRYNDPWNGYDKASDITVDNEGNVYVTGRSTGIGTTYDFYDYATIKYDKDGNELWVKRYNGPGNDDDIANAIAIDNEGNIYVTGGSKGIDTTYDYVTIKYDKDGNELWIARYNGPGNDDDIAHSLIVDKEGNVYVTGESMDLLAGYDYATIKYDKDGNELWVARYKGLSHGSDEASDITLDNEGNVYVTGRSMDLLTVYDYVTIKYDKDGNKLWIAGYDGPGNYDDEAYSIAVDDDENVYVTGRSWGIDTYYDYATIKYDKNGNELWVKRYSKPEGNYDEAFAIAVDDKRNVYVTGNVTIKYSQTESVAEKEIPSGFRLSFAKSNFTNDKIVIKYQLPYTTKFSIVIYDISGKFVKTIAKGKMNSGTYTVNWDGKDLHGMKVSSGIYFIRFETDDYKTTKKLILVK